MYPSLFRVRKQAKINASSFSFVLSVSHDRIDIVFSKAHGQNLATRIDFPATVWLCRGDQTITNDLSTSAWALFSRLLETHGPYVISGHGPVGPGLGAVL